MPPVKRKFKSSYAARAKRARARNAPWRQMTKLASRAKITSRVVAQVNRLTRTIETKQAQWASARNVNLGHNGAYTVQMAAGGDLNPFRCTNGNDDPMGGNLGSRIGDQITIKGLSIVAFLECSLGRAKVFFRMMLVKCPRAQPPTIANGLFQGNSNNKMLDTVNTEKFTIVWQRQFNVSCTNLAPASVGVTGVPATGTAAGIGTRVIRAWIPGTKFGKGGVLKYEDTSSVNPKFFDYRLVIVTYDWYGTPETNNVGLLNEMYTKMYFKDA